MQFHGKLIKNKEENFPLNNFFIILLIIVLCISRNYSFSQDITYTVFCQSIGIWTEYSGWENTGQEARCGSDVVMTDINSSSLSGGIGIDLLFLQISLGINPPPTISSAIIHSNSNQVIVVFKCKVSSYTKFHETYYIVYPSYPSTSGPYYAHPLLKIVTYLYQGQERFYCPQKPWSHPCHVCSSDEKSGKINCIHEPINCDHKDYKTGDSIPCPYPLLYPPPPNQNIGVPPPYCSICNANF